MRHVHSDSELMQRVQRGEVGEFDRLVERYRPALLRVAGSKLGDAGWAEDVVQEAFLAVYAARHTYDPQFAFRTWLWTILLNLCRRRLRKEGRRPRLHVQSALPVGESAWLVPAGGASGLDHLLLAERGEQLAAWLDELPEAQADAIRLRFFGGLPFEGIAEAMSSSVSGAKRRVRNGLVSLSEKVRRSAGELP